VPDGPAVLGGDVAGERVDRRVRRRKLLEPVDPRARGDIGARLGQDGGEACAEAARGAGDDGYPAIKGESRSGHGQTFMK
jgi:hypothetical protein